MTAFRDALVRIPKSEAERSKPIRTVIAEVEQRAGPGGEYARIGKVTVNRHLSCITAAFDWFGTHGYLRAATEPFWTGFFLAKGHKVTGLRARDERPGFSREQIARIFRHPVWTGRKSAYFHLQPSRVIVRVPCIGDR